MASLPDMGNSFGRDFLLESVQFCNENRTFANIIKKTGMKKLIIFSLTSLLILSCSNKKEQQAAERLEYARRAFEANDFNLARTEIDSIKILYPKAVKARKEGIYLMQMLELEEQKRHVVYLDSVIADKQAAFEAIKEKFVLEKDTAYQDIGHYFWPTQTVEKNLHRSFLRFQVSERGVMTMTSVYCGTHHIHHIAVKVIAPDHTFAETPASEDSYETTNMGEKIEKADYLMGKDGNVMGFINLNHHLNLRVEFIGERKYTTAMLPTDRQALKELYELSQILSTIELSKKEREESNLKIGFINRKMEEDRKKEAAK